MNLFCFLCSIDSQSCVQEEVILTDNSIYTSQKTQDGLFCIYKDNSRFIIFEFKLYDGTNEIFTLTIIFEEVLKYWIFFTGQTCLLYITGKSLSKSCVDW